MVGQQSLKGFKVRSEVWNHVCPRINPVASGQATVKPFMGQPGLQAAVIASLPAS